MAMKEIRVNINVWQKDTKWGDTVYFCCDAQNWQWTALTTSAQTFPWWKGEITLETPGKSVALEYKFLVWRENSYAQWESFTGNRKRTLDGNQECIAAKFGETSWWCPLCSTYVTDEIPVVCTRQQHPMHAECFELYICDELERKNTKLTCMKCHDPLPEEAWRDVVNARTFKRYKRVVAESKGATILRCPMSCCDFELVFNEDGGTKDVIPDSVHCEKCGTDWCTKCARQVKDECKICAFGLKGIADQIFDALEEAAGSRCPSCLQRGQKLPCECTHITCDCGEVYCYCCGMAGADVDSSDVYASSVMDRLYGHNDDYMTNEQRCPMWLVNFGDLISDWPDDQDAAQKKFHKMRASRKLLELKDKIDQSEWDSFLQLDENVKGLVEKYLNKSYATAPIY